MHGEGHFDDLIFPSIQCIERIEKYVLLLSPLEKVSRFLEGEKYNTISHVPALLHFIFTVLETPQQELPILVTLRQHLATQVRNRFGNILTEVNPALLAAAVHPVHGHLSFIPPNLQGQVWEKVKEWCNAVYEDGVNQPAPHLAAYMRQAKHLAIDVLKENFKSQQHRILWPFQFNYGEDIKVEAVRPLSQFYEEDEQGLKLYVIIHKVVKMLSCLPCTSAPSERVFSCSGFLKPPLRNRLSPHLLEYLTIIQTYIHAPYYSFESLFQKFCEILDM